MTSKFREALHKLSSSKNGKHLSVCTLQNYDTILKALLIAERLKSGEVSEGMRKSWNCVDGNKDAYFHERAFKAMAKVMIEEVCCE